jgi:hypothetical protein
MQGLFSAIIQRGQREGPLSSLTSVKHCFPMDYDLVPPGAAALVESLRGVGYSIWTAIADIIDNSLSAQAENLWVQFAWLGRHSWISIRDDGRGMAEAELSDAMRAGSRSPLDARDATDLGRFGLGLKTASFSQCRRLTVASKSAGEEIAIRCWDLDEIGRTGEWRLLRGIAPASPECLDQLRESLQGTVVLWEIMDRAVPDVSAADRRAHDDFLETADRVGQHLSMVFHRFLERPPPRFRIFLNGNRLRPWDPFVSDHPATQRWPEERIHGPTSTVTVQGFVLPHKDRLTEAELESGAGPAGWLAQEGFYLYRNSRLLVAGGWLDLGRERRWNREDIYRLARLRVDFSSSADAEWRIDIRKAQAYPPAWLRSRLVALASPVRDRARQVYVHRGEYGRSPPVQGLTRIWKAKSTRAGISYRIDRDHPAVADILRQDPIDRSSLDRLLTLVEQTVPVHRIWLDAVESEGAMAVPSMKDEPEALREIGRALLRHMMTSSRMTIAEAGAQLLRTEPFQDYPEAVASLRQEIEGHTA